MLLQIKYLAASHRIGLLALLLLGLPTLGHAVTINFDEINTGPTGVLHLSEDYYADLGVTFAQIAPNGTRNGFNVVREPVYGNGAYSNPNGVSFGFNHNLMEASFLDVATGEDAVTDFVSLYVGDMSGEADPMTVRAFDINGLLIGTKRFTSQPTNILGVANFGFISFSLVGIHSLLLSDGSTSGASFDNFTFSALRNPNGGGGGGTQVPEPASLALLVSGLLGARTLRRKSA